MKIIGLLLPRIL